MGIWRAMAGLGMALPGPEVLAPCPLEIMALDGWTSAFSIFGDF